MKTIISISLILTTCGCASVTDVKPAPKDTHKHYHFYDCEEKTPTQVAINLTKSGIKNV